MSNLLSDRLPALLKSKRAFSRMLAIAACFVLFILWNVFGFSPSSPQLPRFWKEVATPLSLPCRSLAGANDTLVVLRTGSTEFASRFPHHLSTTIRCLPNYLIFSDVEEHYEGEHILDALESVSDEIRASNKDFELYRKLQRAGRGVLLPSELSGSADKVVSMSGHTDNPGWKLDKWKFMPMVNRTLYEYPDMKWYVFIEADTFILWSMLLQYLNRMDHTIPLYLGSPAQSGSDVFAHGGSGFILSQTAMQKFVPFYAAHKNEIETFIDGHWAGDLVLGKYLLQSGVPLTRAWPHIQGEHVGMLPYTGPDGKPSVDPSLPQWCYPIITYHHMSGDISRELWSFEQR